MAYLLQKLPVKHPAIPSFCQIIRYTAMAGWACSAGIGWMFVGQPLLTGLFSAVGIEMAVPELPQDILFELLLALLGMAGIRSFDKLKGTTA